MSQPTGSRFLTDAERVKLEQYVASSEEDAAYRVRAQLLLLYDDGLPPELAAGQVGVTIHRARSFIRAFDRERLALFPAHIFPAPSSPEEPS